MLFRSSRQNWGTKWEDESTIRGVIDLPDNKRKIVISTYTAWDAPIIGWMTISKQFPNLQFLISYNEPGMCFGGAANIIDGEIRHSEFADKEFPSCEDWEDEDQIYIYYSNLMKLIDNAIQEVTQ